MYFTMSLFVTDLAFEGEDLTAQAKLAILVASLVATAWGLLLYPGALTNPGRVRSA